ncbi:unnamed protein product [marine sediment metagenome]|uniref:Uncharacterized protein n=1 Tax=marine sediment metagenome TaxID=412755 RepID=X1BDH8_9ZZZZ
MICLIFCDLLEEQLEKEREEEKAIRERNRYLLGECLKQAHDAYGKFWDSECEILGRKKGCLLPSWNAERVDKSYKEKRDDCFRIYPQD